MIEIKHLSKTFSGKVRAVRDVSFTIRDNEIFTLLGPNGAGKTTTLRMMATLLRPTGGEVLYDGIPMAEDPIGIRKKISFLTTEIRLEGKFTPNELAFYYGKLYGMTEERILENRDRLFSYFAMNDFADRRFETFSTGMKQKTSIAICLLHDPEIIIFDEPTNGLDVLTQRQIEKAILNLRDMGKCVILSTHLLDVAERLSDRIGMMVDGRSIFEGTAAELAAVSKTKTLSDSFFDLYEENHEEDADEKQ